MSETTVEAPAHIDAVRIDRIGDDDLSAAMGHPGIPSIAELRAAVRVEPDAATWELRRVLAATDPETGVAHLEAAEPLFDDIDVVGAGLGRSARYGWHYLTWLRPLILAYGVSGRKRYARRLEELFTQWDLRRGEIPGEWPSLDVIWYSLGVAGRGQIVFESLAVFGDELRDDTWARMLKIVLGGARWSYDEHTSFRPGNWQLACAARLSEAADVLPDCVEAPQWSARATARLIDHLENDFTADGGHSERAPGYHAMCVGLLQTAAFSALRRGDESIVTDPALLRIHTWLAELTDAHGFTYPFQDSGVDWPGRLMLRGAALCRDPRLMRLAQDWLGSDVDAEVAALPELLQRRLPVPAGPRADERASAHLEGSGYVLLRAPRSRAGLTVATGYGPAIGQELESHSHRAAFDLVLTDRQDILLWEGGGPETYDVPDYHDWYQATRAHNAVTIGGRSIAPDHGARLERLDLGSDVHVVSGRHRGFGSPEHRTISLFTEDPAYVVLSDRGDGHDPDRILRLHAVLPWHPLPDRGDGASWWAIGGGELRVALLDTTAPPRPVELGTSRVPDPTTRTAPFRPLHTLEAPIAAHSTTLLVPGRSGEIPRIERAGDELLVLWCHVRDVVRPDDATRARRPDEGLR